METLAMFAASAAITAVILPQLLEPTNIDPHDRIVNKILKIESIDADTMNKRQSSNGKPFTPDLLEREALDPSKISENAKSMDHIRKAVVAETLARQKHFIGWNLRERPAVTTVAHKKDHKPVLFGSLTGNLNVSQYKN